MSQEFCVQSLLVLSALMSQAPPEERPLQHRIEVLIISTVKKVDDAHFDVNRIKELFLQAKWALTPAGAEKPRFTFEDNINGKPVLRVGEIEFVDPKVVISPKSSKDLFDRVAALVAHPPENTTFFCYCKLHGFCNSNGEHFMFTDGNSDVIPRKQLLGALRAQNPGLTILITDSCSSGPVNLDRLVPQVLQFPKQLFIDLFLMSKGVVDINSSTCDVGNDKVGPVFEQAWMDGFGHGIFTHAFQHLLKADVPNDVDVKLARIDANRDGRYSWEEFFSILTVDTEVQLNLLKQKAIVRQNELLKNKMVHEGHRWELETISGLLAQQHQRPQTRSPLPALP